jgi:hypothetical protein
MARPTKPDLTDQEHTDLMAYPSLRAKTARLNELRGANRLTITEGERRRRRVSHAWVAEQLKKRQKTRPSENPGPAPTQAPSENGAPMYHTGSRIDPVSYAPSLEGIEPDSIQGPVKSALGLIVRTYGQSKKGDGKVA